MHFRSEGCSSNATLMQPYETVSLLSTVAKKHPWGCFFLGEIRKIKCNADERYPLRLDAVDPLFSHGKMQTELLKSTKQRATIVLPKIVASFCSFHFSLFTLPFSLKLSFPDKWYFCLAAKVILYSPLKLSEGQYHYAQHNITAKQYHSPSGEYNWDALRKEVRLNGWVLAIYGATLSFRITLSLINFQLSWFQMLSRTVTQVEAV